MKQQVLPIHNEHESPARYGYGVVVWGISLIFVLFQFFLQLSSAEIVGGLMQSFSLSAFGAGVLSSTYYYIYVVLQTPCGMLVDRIGPRRLLTFGACCVAIGCFMFAKADGVWIAAIGRLIMGTGAAFAFVGSLNLVGKWLPASRFTFFAAIAETVGMLGSIIGSLFLAHFIHRYGWRPCIEVAAAISAVIAVGIWVLVRDCPSGRSVRETRVVSSSILQDLASLVRNKHAWINGAYSGLMFAILTVFVALWAVPYFQLAHHTSLLKATFLADMVFVGVAIGGLLVGWVEAHLKSRRWLFVGSSLISSVLLLIIVECSHLPITWVASLMLLLGFCLSPYVLTFGVANEIVPASMRSTSLGFTNTLSVGTAPLFQPLVGYILTKVALSHHAVNHWQYLTSDYQKALLVIPAIALVAAVVGYFMPDRPLHRKKTT